MSSVNRRVVPSSPVRVFFFAPSKQATSNKKASHNKSSGELTNRTINMSASKSVKLNQTSKCVLRLTFNCSMFMRFLITSSFNQYIIAYSSPQTRVCLAFPTRFATLDLASLQVSHLSAKASGAAAGSSSSEVVLESVGNPVAPEPCLIITFIMPSQELSLFVFFTLIGLKSRL